MAVFIALLRGINVGGKNRIKMAELKQRLAASGLIRVETYIQSGNVLFEAAAQAETLRRKLEDELEQNFGIATPVILRTAGELAQLIRDCPFSEAEIKRAESLNSEGESLYVHLLTQAPAPEQIAELNLYRSAADDYRLKNREVYLLLSHSIRNSRLANSLAKLTVPGTVRNWKTLCKLQDLARARTENP